MLPINITIQMCYASKKKKQYGNGVQFSRIMYPEKIMPRFELSCYRILEEDRVCR